MLAIAGGKGGCGKTTTTLGLAAALSTSGATTAAEPPLSVDADWDLPNLHRLAGVAREPTLTDYLSGTETVGGDGDGSVDDGALAGAFADAACDDAACAEVRDDPSAVVGVVPAPREPPTAPDAAADILSRLRRVETGPVLLDCPAGAGPDAPAPLRAADRAVLVAAPRTADLRAAAKTAALARRLGTPVAGIVLTRVDETLGGRRRRGVERLLDAPVLAAVPDRRPPVLGRRDVAAAYGRAVRRLSDAERAYPAVSCVS